MMISSKVLWSQFSLVALLFVPACVSTTARHERLHSDEDVRDHCRWVCEEALGEGWRLGHFPQTRPDEADASARWRMAPPAFFLARGGSATAFEGSPLELSFAPDPDHDRDIYPFALVQEDGTLRIDYCECVESRSDSP